MLIITIVRNSVKRNRRDGRAQSQASFGFYACGLTDDALIPTS
jgi:hypothetical protein